MTTLTSLICVYKYHANGNDFVVTDNATVITHATHRKQLAHRKFGIGCDQILYIKKKDSKVHCFFYNQDGHEASLCLNGLYVVACHLHTYDTCPTLIYTQKGSYPITIHKDHLKITVPTPTLAQPQPIQIHDTELNPSASCYLVDVGNQHIIILVPKEIIASFPLEKIGKKLQKDRRFPESINVSVITYQPDKETIQMRTFERGVGLTLSCGSAALAAALTIQTIHKVVHSLHIQQPGGNLIIHRNNSEENWQLQSNCSYVATVYWAPPQASPPSSVAQMSALSAATEQGHDN